MLTMWISQLWVCTTSNTQFSLKVSRRNKTHKKTTNLMIAIRNIYNVMDTKTIYTSKETTRLAAIQYTQKGSFFLNERKTTKMMKKLKRFGVAK